MTMCIRAIVVLSCLSGVNASSACVANGATTSENSSVEQSNNGNMMSASDISKAGGLDDEVFFIQRTMAVIRNDGEPSREATADDVASKVRTMSASDRAALKDFLASLDKESGDDAAASSGRFDANSEQAVLLDRAMPQAGAEGREIAGSAVDKTLSRKKTEEQKVKDETEAGALLREARDESLKEKQEIEAKSMGDLVDMASDLIQEFDGAEGREEITAGDACTRLNSRAKMKKQYHAARPGFCAATMWQWFAGKPALTNNFWVWDIEKADCKTMCDSTYTCIGYSWGDSRHPPPNFAFDPTEKKTCHVYTNDRTLGGKPDSGAWHNEDSKYLQINASLRLNADRGEHECFAVNKAIPSHLIHSGHGCKEFSGNLNGKTKLLWEAVEAKNIGTLQHCSNAIFADADCSGTFFAKLASSATGSETGEVSCSCVKRGEICSPYPEKQSSVYSITEAAVSSATFSPGDIGPHSTLVRGDWWVDQLKGSKMTEVYTLLRGLVGDPATFKMRVVSIGDGDNKKPYTEELLHRSDTGSSPFVVDFAAGNEFTRKVRDAKYWQSRSQGCKNAVTLPPSLVTDESTGESDRMAACTKTEAKNGSSTDALAQVGWDISSLLDCAVQFASADSDKLETTFKKEGGIQQTFRVTKETYKERKAALKQKHRELVGEADNELAKMEAEIEQKHPCGFVAELGYRVSCFGRDFKHSLEDAYDWLVQNDREDRVVASRTSSMNKCLEARKSKMNKARVNQKEARDAAEKDFKLALHKARATYHAVKEEYKFAKQKISAANFQKKALPWMSGMMSKKVEGRMNLLKNGLAEVVTTGLEADPEPADKTIEESTFDSIMGAMSTDEHLKKSEVMIAAIARMAISKCISPKIKKAYTFIRDKLWTGVDLAVDICKSILVTLVGSIPFVGGVLAAVVATVLDFLYRMLVKEVNHQLDNAYAGIVNTFVTKLEGPVIQALKDQPNGFDPAKVAEHQFMNMKDIAAEFAPLVGHMELPDTTLEDVTDPIRKIAEEESEEMRKVMEEMSEGLIEGAHDAAAAAKDE